MAIVYNNQFPTDGPPSDFVLSEAGGSGGVNAVVGGKWRMQTGTLAGHVKRGILPAGNWSKADGRCFAMWTTSSPVGNVVPQIMCRTTGNWGTEIDSPVAGYKMIWLNGAGLGLFKRSGATTPQLQSFIAKPVLPLTTYGFVLETVNDVIRCAMFTGATTTAWNGSWDITHTDVTPLMTPGQFQVAMLSQDAAALAVNWDDVVLDDLLSAAPTGPTPRLMRI